MELPAPLRLAVDRLLERTPLAELQRAATLLSSRYRAELRDGRLHLDGELAVKAYLATRLPATYAAIRASLSATAELLPDFAPTTLLDLGAGPGSALWAAADCWPKLSAALLVETSPAARAIGQTLAAALTQAESRWIAGDVTQDLPTLGAADLVSLSYVLDEIAPQSLEPLVDRLWALTTGLLVIVEPGTPAGWRRILAARRQLIDAGAHIVAPCPHDAPCPLAEPDWCHFSRRVARSRLHRLAKGGEVPWEDEKYIFVAASRRDGRGRAARVVAPPRGAKGLVTLKLCTHEGRAGERTLSRRNGDIFRAARRLDWGDTMPLDAG